MRISDWSSDVCSSDLDRGGRNGAYLNGGDDPDDVIPIGFDRRRLDRAVHEAFDAFEGGRRGERAEFPVGAVAQTGHDPEASKDARGKDLVHRAAAKPERRRVGEEGVGTGRSRGLAYQ